MSTAMGTTDSIGGQPATSICGSSGTDSRRSFSYFAVRAIWPSRTGTNVRWLERILDGQPVMTVFEPRAERTPEQAGGVMRVGRHLWHDPRSRQYPYEPPSRLTTLASVMHERHAPILDQGETSSCTGNAMDGDLATSPVWEALPPPALVLDEAEALRLYSAAEVIDGDGPYPPNDNGSYGLSVAKAAKNAGLISGYTHCFSPASMLAALQAGPAIVGMNWYQGFDQPGAGGLVRISGAGRRRHAGPARRRGLAAGLIEVDNSLGTGPGDRGRFRI